MKEFEVETEIDTEGRIGLELVGSTASYIKGTSILHSENSPALVSNNKCGPIYNEGWFRFGKYHREGDLPAYTQHSGTWMTEHFYNDGLLHRDDGPAVRNWDEQFERIRIWYKHGNIHRVDGPASIMVIGDKTRSEWFIDGKYHRCGGPAYEELVNGIAVARSYYQNDDLHNLDGPAVEMDGRKKFYLFGFEYPEALWKVCSNYLKSTSLSSEKLTPDQIINRIKTKRISENTLKIDDLNLYHIEGGVKTYGHFAGMYVASADIDVLLGKSTTYAVVNGQHYSLLEFEKAFYVCGDMFIDRKNERPATIDLFQESVISKWRMGRLEFRFDIVSGKIQFFTYGVLNDRDGHAAEYCLLSGVKNSYRYGELISSTPIEVSDELLKELCITRPLTNVVNITITIQPSLPLKYISLSVDTTHDGLGTSTVAPETQFNATVPEDQVDTIEQASNNGAGQGMAPFLLSAAALAGAAFFGISSKSKKEAPVPHTDSKVEEKASITTN